MQILSKWNNNNNKNRSSACTFWGNWDLLMLVTKCWKLCTKVESVLTFNIVTWHWDLDVKERANLARIVGKAGMIIGAKRVCLSDLCLTAVERKTVRILNDPKHHLFSEFQKSRQADDTNCPLPDRTPTKTHLFKALQCCLTCSPLCVEIYLLCHDVWSYVCLPLLIPLVPISKRFQIMILSYRCFSRFSCVCVCVYVCVDIIIMYRK